MAPRKMPASLLQQAIKVFATSILQYKLLMLTNQFLCPASAQFNPELVAASMSVDDFLSIEDYMVVVSLFLPLTIRVLDFRQKSGSAVVNSSTFHKYTYIDHIYLVKDAIPLEGLRGILPSFLNLKTLIFDDFAICDADIIVIGKNCPHLEVLSLNVALLTDQGIIDCFDEFGINNKLRKIVFTTDDSMNYDMDLRSAKSSAKIIGMCSNLHTFEYDYCSEYYYSEIFELLFGAQQKIYNPNCIKEFLLDFTFSSDDIIDAGQCEFTKTLGRVFPRISRAILYMDDDVLSLMQFANLQDLTLYNFNREGCNQIWSLVGSKLLRVTLKYSALDMLSLAQNCTALTHLHLEGIKSSDISELMLVQGTGANFPLLQFLHIDFEVSSDEELALRRNAQNSMKYLLLHCPILKNLSFMNCHQLVVAFLLEKEFDSLRQTIETLALKQSHLVCAPYLQKLLSYPASQLEEITVTDCLFLNKLNFGFVLDLIKRGNLDIRAIYQDLRMSVDMNGVKTVNGQKVSVEILLRCLEKHQQFYYGFIEIAKKMQKVVDGLPCNQLNILDDTLLINLEDLIAHASNRLFKILQDVYFIDNASMVRDLQIMGRIWIHLSLDIVVSLIRSWNLNG